MNIKKMFKAVNKLLMDSENRTLTTKQVNIYTLNYDEIIEKVLSDMGFLQNVVSSRNVIDNYKFFDIVGFNYAINKYVPTYLISKIHGDIEDPIFPGINKYNEVLESKKFELLFKMKSQLLRINSILIVIGYSGRDEHVNVLIKDCISSGLTIYWFRYKEKDFIPDSLKNEIIIIDQKEGQEGIDTTKIFTEKMEEMWENTSAE